MNGVDSTEPTPARHEAAPWQRLPRRLLVVRAIPSLLALVPIGLAFLLLGEVPASGALYAIVAALLFSLLRDIARIASTRVRVGVELVELRTGVFTTTHRSVPRDRVRTVDVRAGVLQRIAALAVVRIGTGEQSRGEDSGDLELDAVDEHVARRLQQQLLPGTDVDPSGDDATEQLARLRWRWMPWSIVSWWTLALPAILIGSLAQLARVLGVDQPLDEQAARDLASDANQFGTLLLVVVGAAAFLAVGVVARCASFVETWWSFELRRDRAAGLLRARRGLFTKRTTSLQLARIRGMQLREPLLLRPWRVGSASVITTGLADRGESAERGGGTSLGPSAPREQVESVGARVLDTPRAPTAGTLQPHPPAARRRRLVRAAGAAVGAGAATGIGTGRIEFGVLGAALVVAIAVPLALDLARSLGHAKLDGWLVVRSGSLLRRTSVLEVDGIVGWAGRRSYFQRRAGLLTLVAATAAGDGAYAATDAGESQAVAIALAATPDLVLPFIERAGQGPR